MMAFEAYLETEQKKYEDKNNKRKGSSSNRR